MPWPEAVVWAGSRARWQALQGRGRRMLWATYRCRGWWRAVGAVAAARWPAIGRTALTGAALEGLTGGPVGLAWAALATPGHRSDGGWLAAWTALTALTFCGVLYDDGWAAALMVGGFLMLPAGVPVLVGLLQAHADLNLPLRTSLAGLAAAGLLIGARVGAARPTEREDLLIYLYSGHPVEEAGERVWSRLRAGSDPAAAATLVPLCGCWMWQPRHRVVVFCASPVEFTAEAAGGRLRLHRADGPAVRWPDGSVEYWWHGTEVPPGVLTGQWSAARIWRIRNSEVRRAAIEVIGWPEFIRRAKLHLVATAPDPGNPGRDLRLYDLPLGTASTPTRLLLITNGSPDRDGHDRTYAETVPGNLDDPIAAAAWQYDVPADTYRQLQRRT
jgi:hypothetical protein